MNIKKICFIISASSIALLSSCTGNHEHEYTIDTNQNDGGCHYFACSCGDMQTEQHTFGEWVVEQEATEEEDGIQTKECSTCHFKLSELIPQKQHFCTITRKYSTEQCWNECRCGEKYDIHEHRYKSEIAKEATEEEEGLYNLSCLDCDYTTTKVIEKLPHTHSFEAFYSNEKHYTQCNCGEIGYEESHCLKEKILQQPTETEEGLKGISCTGCQYSTTEVIEKTPHQHSFEQFHNAENHYSKCKCGEIINEEKHNLVSEVIKKATEEEEGQTKTSCTNCSYETTEAIAKIPHKHSYGDIIYTNDDHYKECSCGEKYYVSHHYKSYTIKEATLTEEGIKREYCLYCSKENYEAIPVISHEHIAPVSDFFLTDTVPDSTLGIFTATCEVCANTFEKKSDITNRFIETTIDGKQGYRLVYVDNVEIPYIPSIYNSLDVIEIDLSKLKESERNNISTIILPDTILKISDCAFREFEFESISIPDSVKYLGEYSFGWLQNLCQITIPENVSVIPKGAFYRCDNLKNVEFKGKSIHIGSMAFYETSLVSIKLPITNTVDSNAFDGCVHLVEIINYTSDKKLTLSNSKCVFHSGISHITTIDDFSFLTISGEVYLVDYLGTNKNIILPDSFQGEKYSIVDYLFWREKVERITLGKMVSRIEHCSFFSGSLKSIELNENLEHIAAGAFKDYFLEGNVYENVKYLGTKDNPYFAAICLNVPASFYAQRHKYYVGGIHPDCKILSEHAFEYAYFNDSIIIPDGITKISDSAFWRVKGKNITLSESIDSIEEYAFAYSTFEHVILNEGLTTIKRAAFLEAHIKEISLPTSLSFIEEDAFCSCSALHIVENKSSLPIVRGEENYGSVAYFANAVIASYDELVEKDDFLFVKENDTYQIVEYIGTSDIVYLPEGESEYEIPAFLFSKNKYISEVYIPSNVTKINGFAFSECSNLSKIVLGENVQYIGMRAFEKCTKLVKFTGTKSLEYIDHYAFRGCSNLCSVILDKNTSLEYTDHDKCYSECVFIGCGKLVERIYSDDLNQVESAVEIVDNFVFYTNEDHCYLMAYIGNEPLSTLPELYKGHTYEIYGEAFMTATISSILTIPEGVTGIGNSVFPAVNETTRVIIPCSVESFGDNYNLINIYFFFKSSESEVDTISINKNAMHVSYYSENTNSEEQKYWHYDANMNPVFCNEIYNTLFED